MQDEEQFEFVDALFAALSQEQAGGASMMDTATAATGMSELTLTRLSLAILGASTNPLGAIFMALIFGGRMARANADNERVA